MNEDFLAVLADRLCKLETENGYRISEIKQARRDLDHLLRATSEPRSQSQSGALERAFPFIRSTDSAVGPFFFAANDSVIGRSIEAYGEWCQNEILLLRAFLAPGDLVIDVGANIGYHTRAFSQAVGPKGTVLAFEPQGVSSLILRINALVAEFNNIHVINGAVSDQSGLASVADIDLNRETNHGNIEIVDYGCGKLCAMLRLDDLQLPGPPALIKIDVEGHEIKVINGAIGLIQKSRPVVFVETDNGSDTVELCARIKQLKYQIFLFTSFTFRQSNFKKNPIDIWDGQGYSRNAICIPEGYSKTVQKLPTFDHDGRLVGLEKRMHYEDAEIVSANL